jgi:hypothetical protein
MSTEKPRGYVAMPRTIFDDKTFPPEPFTQREAYLYVVAAAAWKPRQDRIGRAVVDLQRGQFAASTRFLASRWGWSEARVRRFLTRLSKRRTSDAAIDAQHDAPIDALIDAVSTRDITVITIRNYDEFNKSAPSDKSQTDAPIDAAIDAQRDAPRDSKSTQIGEVNLEVNNTIPFPEGNGDARQPTGSNVVSLSKAKAITVQSAPKIPDPEFAQTPSGTVFGECRKYLQRAAELSPDQARRMLGRWRKTNTDGEIIDAISRAQREEAQDPVAFITGCFRQRQRGQRPTGAMSAIQAMEDAQ